MLFYLSHWDWVLFKSRSDIADYLRADGFKICSITPTNKYRKSIYESFNNHYEWKINRKKILDIIAIIKLKNIIKNINQNDILHIFTLKSGIYFVLASIFHQKRYKVIVSITGLGYLFSNSKTIKIARFLMRPLLIYLFNKNVDYLIFQNKQDLNLFIKYINFKNKSSIIRGSGINTTKFELKEIDHLRDEVKVLMCNRLLKDKGIKEYFDLSRKLSNSKNLNFFLAGEIDPGNPASYKKEDIEKLISLNNVNYLGNINVEKKLKDFDILIHMSSHEGLPRIVLESMYVGLATISNNLPGVNEIYDTNDNLYLIENNNLDDYVKTINTFPKDDLEEKIKYSRKKVINKFSTDYIYNKFKEIYESIL